MKLTKQLTASLALLMLLASCGDAGSQPVQTQAVTESGTDAVESVTTDPTAIYDPNIEAVDYGGDIFNIIYGDNDFEPNLDVCAESTNGEPLNDAIYNRNLALKEKYNIDITWERLGLSRARRRGYRPSVHSGREMRSQNKGYPRCSSRLSAHSPQGHFPTWP